MWLISDTTSRAVRIIWLLIPGGGSAKILRVLLCIPSMSFKFDGAAFRSQRGHPKVNGGMMMNLKINILKSNEKELFLLIDVLSILIALRPFNAAGLRSGPQVNCQAQVPEVSNGEK